MTIEEAKAKYGDPKDNGYVFCDNCPAHFCAGAFNGFDECWKYIAEYITALEPDPGNSEKNAVDHPSHYNQGEIECIDAMKAAFGADELAVYCKIAAFKYVWRCEHKNGVEDIRKAVWYLNKYLELKEDGADD